MRCFAMSACVPHHQASDLELARGNIPVIELPDNARYANGPRDFLVLASPMMGGARITAKHAGRLAARDPIPQDIFTRAYPARRHAGRAHQMCLRLFITRQNRRHKIELRNSSKPMPS
jgi:hypothetical protein